MVGSMGSIYAEKALYGSGAVLTNPAKSGIASGSASRGMRAGSCDFIFGAVCSSAVQDRSGYDSLSRKYLVRSAALIAGSSRLNSKRRDGAAPRSRSGVLAFQPFQSPGHYLGGLLALLFCAQSRIEREQRIKHFDQRDRRLVATLQFMELFCQLVIRHQGFLPPGRRFRLPRQHRRQRLLLRLPPRPSPQPSRSGFGVGSVPPIAPPPPRPPG